MAIEPVDIDPDNEDKSKRVERADVPTLARRSEAEALRESAAPLTQSLRVNNAKMRTGDVAGMISLSHALPTLLTLAFLVSAETPSEQERVGLEILITVSVAVSDCENLRFDSDRIGGVVASYGVKQSDVSKKYREFSVAYASDLMKAADTDPGKFCMYALAAFGPQGTIPGLIVRQ